jgi:CheY-like chemotaxis protein
MSDVRSILIVEDEPLIAMMLEDFILSIGHEVSGNCDSVKSALEQVEQGSFDLAILDVNLKGESVWPVAAALRDKGTPFVLASGGHVDPPPPEFRNVPMIEKPYTIDRVTPIIDAALAAGTSSS